MFNGIIFNKGKVSSIDKRKKGINLFLKSSIRLNKNNIGDSISCDGVCLTLISFKKNILEFYLSKETLNKSNFKHIKIGNEINLEPSLKFGQNISVHICQGHVDTVAKLIRLKKVDKTYVFEFKLPVKFKNSLVPKASILVNGVSLTISKIKKQSFEIWIIPHTLKLTNLNNLKKNAIVNVEIDILSKYVKKYLNAKN